MYIRVASWSIAAMTDTQAILNPVASILAEAGATIILPAYHAAISPTTKTDGSIVTETDLASQRHIRDALLQLAPDIAFLGEEMSEAEQLACLQQSDGCYWCLDPLDGTSNFVAGFPGFAISLALIEQGRPQLTCIHDPVRGETFTAIHGRGAELNGAPITASAQQQLAQAVGFIDFKRLDAELATRLVTAPPYRSQRNIGSCALEWAWLAAGRGQFIIHGCEKLWDFAAGSLIAAEAGCPLGDFDGNALFPRDTLSAPILAACNAVIHASLKLELNG